MDYPIETTHTYRDWFFASLDEAQEAKKLCESPGEYRLMVQEDIVKDQIIFYKNDLDEWVEAMIALDLAEYNEFEPLRIDEVRDRTWEFKGFTCGDGCRYGWGNEFWIKRLIDKKHHPACNLLHPLAEPVCDCGQIRAIEAKRDDK